MCHSADNTVPGGPDPRDGAPRGAARIRIDNTAVSNGAW